MKLPYFFCRDGRHVDDYGNALPIGLIDQAPNNPEEVAVYLISPPESLSSMSKLLDMTAVTRDTPVFDVQVSVCYGSLSDVLDVAKVLDNVVFSLEPNERYLFSTQSLETEFIPVTPAVFMRGKWRMEKLERINNEQGELVWSRKRGWEHSVYLKLVRRLLSMIDGRLKHNADLAPQFLSQSSFDTANLMAQLRGCDLKIHKGRNGTVDFELEEYHCAQCYRLQVPFDVTHSDFINAYFRNGEIKPIEWRGSAVDTCAAMSTEHDES